MMTKMKKMNVLIYQVTRFARDNNFGPKKKEFQENLNFRRSKFQEFFYIYIYIYIEELLKFGPSKIQILLKFFFFWAKIIVASEASDLINQNIHFLHLRHHTQPPPFVIKINSVAGGGKFFRTPVFRTRFPHLFPRALFAL